MSAESESLKLQKYLAEQIMMLAIRAAVLEKILIDKKIIDEKDYVELLRIMSDEVIEEQKKVFEKNKQEATEVKKDLSKTETEIK